MADQNNIGINLNLLVGLPEDDEESLKETYEFIKKFPYVETVSFFRPIPGTSILRDMTDGELSLGGNTNLDGYLKHYSSRWTNGVHLPTKYLSKERVVYWKQRFDELIGERGITRHFSGSKEVSNRIRQRKKVTEKLSEYIK